MDLLRKKDITIPIHRLLPFSNVEGIGNRCSIFVQGCNLNCEYCHNRETIPMVSENTKNLSIDEIVSFIKQSMPFIRGITVSGGEPTLYGSQLRLLFNEVHLLGLSCYIDTNGFFDFQKIKKLIMVTDKFLFDIKGDNSGLKELCFSLKSSENKLFDESTSFNNLQQLLELDKIEEVRFVFIKNRLREEDVIVKIASILKNHQTVPLRIIPVHTKGLDQQHRSAIINDVPTDNDVKKLRDLAFSIGVKYVM